MNLKQAVNWVTPAVMVNVHDSSVPDKFMVKPKLPKLILPKFSGEIIEFRGFWDRFQTAVHNNPSFSTVDKFTYLHALLEGSAARSIQGLALTEGNYKTVMEILKSFWQHATGDIRPHRGPFKTTCMPWRKDLSTSFNIR